MSAAFIKCEYCGTLCDALISVQRRVYRPTEQHEGIYITTAAATFCDWPCLAKWSHGRGPEYNPSVMFGDA